MAKADRIIKMLTQSYNMWFFQEQSNLMMHWNQLHADGPTTFSMLMGDGRIYESTVSEENYSPAKVLASSHKVAWQQSVRDVSQRYGNVFGLEPMEYVLYDQALRTLAPKEWLAEFAGKPIPTD